ncbi:hypothetical protein KSF78_0008309 [Schistosoma japonicum]|nr:hypothetical protein KSF78_0008309 [Schistosoma japonicum]KAH8874260.1 hypothetical protein KSF78_0008309 [Schistosoma japonicum]
MNMYPALNQEIIPPRQNKNLPLNLTPLPLDITPPQVDVSYSVWHNMSHSDNRHNHHHHHRRRRRHHHHHHHQHY